MAYYKILNVYTMLHLLDVVHSPCMMYNVAYSRLITTATHECHPPHIATDHDVDTTTEKLNMLSMHCMWLLHGCLLLLVYLDN